ncbi:MAG: type II secretion system F family protein [Bacillota bacterium]|nr:type II secretion system F family protein [Bacillota bacterium]
MELPVLPGPLPLGLALLGSGAAALAILALDPGAAWLPRLSRLLRRAALVSRRSGLDLFDLWRQRRQRRARREAARRSLVAALDLLAEASEAGLNLLQAVRLTGEEVRGPMGEALRQVADRIERGQEPLHALGLLHAELGLDELRGLERTLRLGQSLGAPVAETLRTIAADALEEEATRQARRIDLLPLKLTLVTGAFLLPPILVVVLVPSLLRFLADFG